MKLQIVKHKDTSRKGVFDFINDKEIVRFQGEIYLLVYELTGDERVLYSLPSNDRHKPFTKWTATPEHKKIRNPKTVHKYWGRFKEGDKIAPKEIKDGKFII